MDKVKFVASLAVLFFAIPLFGEIAWMMRQPDDLLLMLGVLAFILLFNLVFFSARIVWRAVLNRFQ